jgi:hypothetical protein
MSGDLAAHTLTPEQKARQTIEQYRAAVGPAPALR